MQKALTKMNLQLRHIVADITGSTGLRIIRAMLAGEHDREVLPCLRRCSCHSSAETIAKALTVSYRTEHLFALEQALALCDAYREKASACDVRIEVGLKSRLRHRTRSGERSGFRRPRGARFPAAKCSRHERAGSAGGLRHFYGLPPQPLDATTPRSAPFIGDSLHASVRLRL
jgi:hypothetical protein